MLASEPNEVISLMHQLNKRQLLHKMVLNSHVQNHSAASNSLTLISATYAFELLSDLPKASSESVFSCMPNRLLIVPPVWKSTEWAEAYLGTFPWSYPARKLWCPAAWTRRLLWPPSQRRYSKRCPWFFTGSRPPSRRLRSARSPRLWSWWVLRRQWQ